MMRCINRHVHIDTRNIPRNMLAVRLPKHTQTNKQTHTHTHTHTHARAVYVIGPDSSEPIVVVVVVVDLYSASRHASNALNVPLRRKKMSFQRRFEASE